MAKQIIITFNQDGSLLQADSSAVGIRQGDSNGEVTIRAVFQNRRNDSYVAKFHFERPDGKKQRNVIMTPSSTASNEYDYAIGSAWFFAVPGTAKVTVTITDGTGAIAAQGSYSFNVEATQIDVVDSTLTYDEAAELEGLIADLDENALKTATRVTLQSGATATDFYAAAKAYYESDDLIRDGDRFWGSFTRPQINATITFYGEFIGSNSMLVVQTYYAVLNPSRRTVTKHVYITYDGSDGNDLKELATTEYVDAYFDENDNANRAVADQLGNVIDETYAPDDSVVHNTGDEAIGGNKIFSSLATFSNGAVFSNDSAFDGDTEFNGEATFDQDVTLGGSIKKGGTSYAITIPDKSGTMAVESYVISEVAKIVNGDYTANKAKNDEDGNQIKATYETKADATAKLLRSNLVTIIGEATQSLSGLLSATDKARLDALYALLGTIEDSDTVVNTINEVLAIFNQYPEGVTLTNALALKVAFTDVINNLTSNEINKPLSAYQGQVLKGLIDTIQSTVGELVPKSRTIAGINLRNDISESGLSNSLCDSDLIADSDFPTKSKLLGSIFTYVEPKNLYNRSAVITGRILANGANSGEDNFRASDYVKVNPNDVLAFADCMTATMPSLRFWICAYDRHKKVIASAGSNSQLYSYTVPNDVYYIRFSYVNAEVNSKCVFYKGDAPTGYSAFFVPYYKIKVKNSGIDEDFSSNSLYGLSNKTISNFFGISKIYPKNLLNFSALQNKYMDIAGNEYASDSYRLTGLIPVSQGQQIRYQKNGSLSSWRFMTAYSENMEVVLSAGTNDGGSAYEVPAGVSFIRLSVAPVSRSDNPMVFVGTTAQTYEPYFKPYWKANAYDIDIEQLSFAEWENLFDKETALPRTYVANGSVNSSDSYFASDYIEVEPNTAYSFMANSGITNARFIDEYDASKTFIRRIDSTSTITTTANTKYVRCSFYNVGGGVIPTTTVVKGSTPVYGLKHKKLIPSTYIKSIPNVSILLPKEICCAVGTTIEIYNDQVMPCADRYHFQWTCNVGKALNRKFSVTGVNGNVGTYALNLAIYDDDFNLVASGTSSLKIVSALATQKTICPIGDSLTNGKYWLKYVNVDLSSGNIAYVGTRGSTSGQKHEGRSGATTTFYLTNSTYDFEPPATPNPFWSSSLGRFSLSYYKSTYSINPDAIQIWLGTNDLLGMSASAFVNNVKTMIADIRLDDASIPIFIALTILPAEQNGIGAQTSNDGFSSAAGRWQYQWWNTIIAGVKLLEEELIALNDSHLHIIPLVCSHDCKYNFGIVDTPVNPHTPTITEPMPVEGVHPQQNGYEQIGDIMWGVYCAKLSS